MTRMFPPLQECSGALRTKKARCSLRPVLFAIAFFALALSAWGEPIRITDIRFWQSPEEAQIVFDLSGPPSVSQVNSLRDGTFHFDIRGCIFRPGKQTYPLRNVFMDTLTVQERDGGMVRVFFRTALGVQQKTFVLPRNPAKPDRIVIFLSEPPAAVQARRDQELREVRRLKAGNVRIVVLDPGHGGEDPGTNHHGVREKDYVLEMGKLIKSFFDQDPRYRAILTRTGDYIIPLERRRKIAEHLGADAFVSLHINYNRKRDIQGIEVYYESPRGAVGEAERLVAEMENQQDVIGGVSAGTTPVETRANIVQMQAAAMFKSGQFAEKVEARLANSVPGLISRGVKRAGFKVLHSMTMPSILVEYGYISNPIDVQLLRQPQVKNRLAQATYLGVRDFLEGIVRDGVDTSYFEYLQQVEESKRLAALRKAEAAKKRALAGKNKKGASHPKGAAAKSQAKSYKVKAGDTLSGIAKSFGVSTDALAKANKRTTKTHVRVGETLVIPGK
jgi:N-acetylmuramoyl-L-alanine amidase